jgi:hypothetical protein
MPDASGPAREHMTTHHERMAEAGRLEQLWSGQFGDAYIERDRAAGGEPWAVLAVGANRVDAPECAGGRV